MKIVVKYAFRKWEWTEKYGIKDLPMLVRHLLAKERTVLAACIITSGRIVTLV